MILVIFSLILSLIWNLNKVPSVVFSVKDEIMSGSIRYIPVSSFVYSLLRFSWKYCGNSSTTGKINLPKRVNPLSVEVSRKVRIIKNNWQVLRHRVLGAFRWDWCARRLVFVLGTLIQQTLYELFSFRRVGTFQRNLNQKCGLYHYDLRFLVYSSSTHKFLKKMRRHV